jgi:hypothetical protein
LYSFNPILWEIIGYGYGYLPERSGREYGKAGEGIHQFAQVVERLTEAAEEAERRG